MFKKILIANRGEIACRVAATAHRMGIAVVAVYSEADAHARHVRFADEAYCIGPAPARDSYLNIAAILDAARRSGAEAIHPGYGFLSENADFAAACESAGIAFIGPPASAIRAMGSKSAAKTLMEKAGVPLLPGYHGEDQDPAHLAAEAARIGYPVLIKASSGGGGRGMRIVNAAEEFSAALASCKREAEASFGDAQVLIEKYLRRPRHIEVQVFADQHGDGIALFERDCSVQRRHQKVLEEAPAPGMTEARRAAMGDAAVAAAKAVGYVGAGTVEFIVDTNLEATSPERAFHFMEMNTRLQVEHPVTEMITGLDLVQWQLEVAAGAKLSSLLDDNAASHVRGHAGPRLRGHAMEARVYAENPRHDFMPATGVLHHFRPPEAVEFQRGNESGHNAPPAASPAPVRVDAGFTTGDTVTPFYDAMLAKVIAWGETRAEALARLSAALAQFQVAGVDTNIEFLGRVLGTQAFASGAVHTGLIEENAAQLFAPAPAPSEEALVAAALSRTANNRTVNTRAATSFSPWDVKDGWQANLITDSPLRFKSTPGGEQGQQIVPGNNERTESKSGEHSVVVRYARGGTEIDAGSGLSAVTWEALPDVNILGSVGSADATAVPTQGICAYRIVWRGHSFTATVVEDHARFDVFIGSEHAQLEFADPLAAAALADTTSAATAGSLIAPMPGRIAAVLAEPGARVKAGTPVLVLEAMKMEHTIAAAVDGVVSAVYFKVGDQVTEGAELATITTDPAKAGAT